MSEHIEWIRPSGLSITLQDTENLNKYAINAGWNLADESVNKSNHEIVILGMDDKKEIEDYVKEIVGIDIDMRGKLSTVQSKGIKAIKGAL